MPEELGDLVEKVGFLHYLEMILKVFLVKNTQQLNTGGLKMMKEPYDYGVLSWHRVTILHMVSF